MQVAAVVGIIIKIDGPTELSMIVLHYENNNIINFINYKVYNSHNYVIFLVLSIIMFVHHKYYCNIYKE